jgi:hypothetical protein
VRTLWLGLLLLLCGGPVEAAQIQNIEVTHTHNRYHIAMQVTLEAGAAHAFAVFSDYRNLTQINHAVQSAEILSSPNVEPQQLATTINVCFLFFCRELKQLQEMRRSQNAQQYRLDARIVPAQSDFSYGQAQWTMASCGQQTCMTFEAELEPDFWVPPLIGPWVIQRKLRLEAQETAEGIERLAQLAP